MSEPEVSAVIVNYWGAHLLPECLSSLAKATVPVETIVVDNGSRDGSEAVVRSFPGVRFLPLGKNEGLARAYNAGAREARSPLLFFANNDMEFAPDCLERLARAVREPGVFAADPRHLSWERTEVTHGAQRVSRSLVPLRPALPFLDAVEDRTSEAPQDVFWGCAGALLVRRELFLELGGFDSTFFLYMEDVDLCIRAWLRGWRTVHEPGATLRHRVSASHDASLLGVSRPGPRPPRTGLRVRASIERNALRLALKALPARWVAAALASTAARAARDTLRGRSTALWAALALASNVLDLPSVLRARGETRRSVETDFPELVSRFERR